MNTHAERCMTPPDNCSDLQEIFQGMQADDAYSHPRYDFNPGWIVTDVHRVGVIAEKVTWEKLTQAVYDIDKTLVRVNWASYLPGPEKIRNKQPEDVKTSHLKWTRLKPLLNGLVGLVFDAADKKTINTLFDAAIRYIERRAFAIQGHATQLPHVEPIRTKPSVFLEHLVKSKSSLIIPVQGRAFDGWKMEEFLESFDMLDEFLHSAPTKDLSLIYIIDSCPTDRLQVQSHPYRKWIECETLYRAAMEHLARSKPSNQINKITWFMPLKSIDENANNLIFENRSVKNCVARHAKFLPKASQGNFSYSVGASSENGIEYMLTSTEDSKLKLDNIEGKPLLPVMAREADPSGAVLTQFVNVTKKGDSDCCGWSRLSVPEFLGLPRKRIDELRQLEK